MKFLLTYTVLISGNIHHIANTIYGAFVKTFKILFFLHAYVYKNQINNSKLLKLHEIMH